MYVREDANGHAFQGVCLRVQIPSRARASLPLFEFCNLDVSASRWSLVQRSPTECGVSECYGEASTMKRPWPTSGYNAMEQMYGTAVIGVKWMLLLRFRSWGLIGCLYDICCRGGFIWRLIWWGVNWLFIGRLFWRGVNWLFMWRLLLWEY